MIPEVEEDMIDIEVETEPSRTYALDIENGRIRGIADELEAVKQAVYLILNTERYDHLIYSWDYGVELKELAGEQKEYAYPEIQRCITEAVLEDDRITAVDDFKFESSLKSVHVKFTVYTIYGELEGETNV